MTTSPRITVRQSDRNYGPYSLEQVNALLVVGRVRHDDLAWVEGSPDWQALVTVPGVVAVPPLPTPPPSAQPLAPDESERLLLPAFLLLFFLGLFGVHRFYVGKTGSGITMLVLTCTGVGVLVTLIWWVVDLVVMLFGNFTDADEKRLRRWI